MKYERRIHKATKWHRGGACQSCHSLCLSRFEDLTFGSWNPEPKLLQRGVASCHKQHAANNLRNWRTFRKLPGLITLYSNSIQKQGNCYLHRFNMTQYDSIWLNNYDSIWLNMTQYDSILSHFWSWFDSICLETSRALMPQQTLPRLSVRLPRPQRDILGATERPCP